MSKDLYPLYPSNSKVIDLRSKITMAPMSKTKQFFNELQKISGSSPTKTSLHAKRAYESERWFSPRIDSEEADTSAPPRRSMFTPSRLQLLSAQRGREMRKPYWRCPIPATKPSELQIMPTLSDIITTPTVRQGPLKPFRRREPETGRKTNSFAVDEDILTVEEREKEQLMNKVQLPGAPKAGFLGPASFEDLFAFSDPIVRAPRLGTKEIATQTDQDSIGLLTKTGMMEKDESQLGGSPSEAVKTSSYGVHSSSVPFSEPKSTFGGFGQHHGTNANGLSAPVGVVAQAISSSQIRLAWTDPNQNAFNQIYTIKYGVSNSDEAQHKLLNSTETEHTFEGLRPDTQYEFAVRLAQSPHCWSLNAVTRTQPAPPSPPRDLTIIGAMSSHQQVDNNPSTVALTWQPPKYSNGGIQAPNAVQSGGFTFGAVPPASGPFQFGTAPPIANGNAFQFGTAPPMANGNSYQFADSSESSSAAVRHGVSARKLLLARRKKR